MAKFRIFSDIHTEFGRFKNWPRDCLDTILLLPGDIGVGLCARNMITEMCQHYKAVVMICGNHEYYNHKMEEVDARFHKMATEIDNFFFLNNSTVFFDDVRIIGGTMWTSIENGWFNTVQTVRNSMNDFNAIRYYDSPERGFVLFTTKKWMELHEEFKKFFDAEIRHEWAGKTIVMTHHSPCGLSVAEEFKCMALNAGYYEDMTDYMFGDEHAAPVLWVHGHMHNQSDYEVGKTRVICNPRGYVGHEVNPHFNVNLTVEI